MTKPIIKIENLSKQYRLGSIGTGTLSNDLKRWWYKVRGKEDPFLKIGEVNVRSQKGESEYVWALKDINLEVMPGDVLGIIGKNGAGKSTLLKILSRVTGPTTGRIDFNGRIGSLLEVGTGFHPELTGRENIFLNGAILGMTKAEIRSKLDEIIDFSGCERYIDTPVKRYSSGMMVRLGFAVAAHLEPEILVVDEVLAVGDAEFQKKAIGKMQDVSKNEGRTVLFVSHNMASIQSLCTKGVVMENGAASSIQAVDEAIQKYLDYSNHKENVNSKIKIMNKAMNISKLSANGSSKNKISLDFGDNIICLGIEGEISIPLNISVEAMLFDETEKLIAMYSPTHLTGKRHHLEIGQFKIEESIKLPDTLTNGEYYFSVRLSQMNIEHIAEISKFVKIINNRNYSKTTGVSFDKRYFGYFLLYNK